MKGRQGRQGKGGDTIPAIWSEGKEEMFRLTLTNKVNIRYRSKKKGSLICIYCYIYPFVHLLIYIHHNH